MPNPRHVRRNSTKNVRLKQLKKNMLEKETQNFINRYVSEIKECFNNKTKCEKCVENYYFNQNYEMIAK